MKKWIFLILAVLLICVGVFGWWIQRRTADEAAAFADQIADEVTAKMRKDRKIPEKMNQAEEDLKKNNPELHKLATQPAKDK